MERIINNAGFEGIAKNIFMMLNLKDLAKCRQVSRSFNGFVENPRFWLKKLISRGLSKKNQKDWIAAIDKTKDTDLIKSVLLYFKKILKKHNFIDVPCFIDKRRRRSMRSLQRNQMSLEKFYYHALEDRDMEGLQILAPLMENSNAPLPSEPMARSSRFLKQYAGWTPIQVAAANRWTQVLKILAPLGDNLNDSYPSTTDGFTPIFRAALLGHAEIVEVIAPLVVDPNRENEDGITPLGAAIKNGHLNVVKILVPFVDDLNNAQQTQSEGGMSAIGLAAIHGHSDVIKFLAKFVNPIAPTAGGYAPIFGAIVFEHPKAVKLLAYLSRNLSTPLTRTTPAFTPIEIAEYLGNNEIVTILKNAEKAIWL